MTPDRTLAGHETLVAALTSADAYPHAAEGVRMLETHISSVLLAGPYAYKLKKPLALGFLDFSTLQARRRSCEDEVRLNARTAPDLYLDVVPITGDDHAPRIGGDGPAIEYAVRMRRFSNDGLLDRMAREGTLAVATVEALAERVAAFHSSLPPAAPDSPWGTPSGVHRWARDNLAEILSHELDPSVRARIATLATWTDETFDRRSHQFAARRHHGHVRECHGDLHLRNVVLIDGAPVPFDCIEFNPELRWIDVSSEIAFTWMDLLDHGLRAHATRFLDRYLECTGDYGALGVLRFYAVYRALVRGKVALIRAGQDDATDAERAAANASFLRHLALAESLAGAHAPVLVLMHGLSASGKSTVAARIALAVEGVRVRSDVERKRLHGLAATARSGSPVGGGLYEADASRRTYERLADAARAILDAGFPAVIDATFLRRADRDLLAAVAREEAASAFVADCVAPEAVLRARIESRAAKGADPSEATSAVLDRQLIEREPIAAEEGFTVIAIDTAAPSAAYDAAIGRAAAAIAARSRGSAHDSPDRARGDEDG